MDALKERFKAENGEPITEGIVLNLGETLEGQEASTCIDTFVTGIKFDETDMEGCDVENKKNGSQPKKTVVTETKKAIAITSSFLFLP